MIIGIVCPDPRDALKVFGERKPIALTPMLGICLLERLIAFHADRGCKEFRVFASDRPGDIREFVGDGSRWGVRAEILPTQEELSLEQVLERLQKGAPEAQVEALVADHIPEFPQSNLLESSSAWYDVAFLLMESKTARREIGVIEKQPGVWVGVSSKIADSATIEGPVWLGQQVWIGEDARIGPGSVLERGVVVDKSGQVTRSLAMDHTYIGALTEVNDSYAVGSRLMRKDSGSVVDIVDVFLLNDLNNVVIDFGPLDIVGRFAALVLGMLTAPLVLIAGLFRLALWKQARVVYAAKPMRGSTSSVGGIRYWELASDNWLLKRWPQWWNIVRGEFRWFGNPPISPADAASLVAEHETLWLHAPIGLFTLARAETGHEKFDEETMVHSSYYAATQRNVNRWAILKKCLLRNVS